MPDLSTLGIVAAASVALVIVPGPAVIYILTRSISQGRAAGIASAVGVNLGSTLHVIAAVAGLSVILASSATAYAIVRWAGIGYLAWLGIRTLTASDDVFASPTTDTSDVRRVFAQGVLVNALNPKVAVFFLAFLPQFIDPNAPDAALQTFVLGMTLIIIGLISDSVYALLGGRIGATLHRRPGAARTSRIVAGSVYLGLAGLAAVTGSRPTN